MKKWTSKLGVIALVMAFASLGAQAQTASTPANNGSLSVKAVIGFGASFGGDSIASAQYTNGNNVNIRAGEVVTFKGGAEFALSPSWTLQTTIGWHFAKANANNGNVTFQRYPLEGIVFYQAAPNFRMGLGLRKSLNASLSASGLGTQYATSQDYSSKLAGVAEGEFLMGPHFGITLRAVSENFKRTDGSTVNGSHGGIGFNYYF